ncbi:hypothetical protein V1512DRAFT_256027 [Lipomyces arxii]|uniref:uncharacterized protein n=1 Tax=Lipomyces arxii TaxID=56418 RepID=UPI0034CDE46E
MSEGPILFTYDSAEPLPGTVCVAGDFNSWAPAPMSYNDGSKKFECCIMLENEKNYLYKFVIDGNWILDPKAESVWDNGFENSIVRVSEDKYFVPEQKVVETVEAKAEDVVAAVEATAEPAEVKLEDTVGAVEETAAPAVEEAKGVMASMTEMASDAIVAATDAVGATVDKVMEALPESAPTLDDVAAATVPEAAAGAAETSAETTAVVVPDVAAEQVDVKAAVTENSDLSSIEHVVTGNTTITTPELMTPVKEEAKKLVPDVPAPVLEVPTESSSVETVVPTPAPIIEVPSAIEPLAPAVVGLTTGIDTAVAMPDPESVVEPESTPLPAAGYETAQKTKQHGLLDKIYEFISTSILGKLFQYVFSIFNRSA